LEARLKITLSKVVLLDRTGHGRLQFERLLMSFEGNDVVKWRNNKRVERKEVAEAVLRGCIGGGISERWNSLYNIVVLLY
jgi:hypothetical protein